MNKIILIGRLVRDPELKYTASSKPVANFALAVDREFQRDKTDFIDCVAWNKTAELVARHLGKGRLVAVEGELQVRTWEANDGTKRKAAEVVVGRVKFLDGGRRQEQEDDLAATASEVLRGQSGLSFDDDDDTDEPLPF